MMLRILLLFSVLNSLVLCMKFAEKCCGKGMNFGTVGVHTQDGFLCAVTDKVFGEMEKEFMLTSNLERIMCKGFYRQCCITAARAQYCVLGMSFGRANQICLAGSNKMAGKAQQTCCDCCKSGRKAGSKRADCDSVNFNDHLCTYSYKQCCNEIKSKLPVEPVKDKKKTCKDIKCEFKSTESCTETSKGPQCICKDGYIGLNDGITCIDINECTNGDKKCNGTSKCVNEPGSYKCSCDQGYVYDNKTCVESKKDDACSKGYKKINGKCVDIDECLTSANKCPSHMFCLNLEGSHDCLASCNYPKYEYVYHKDKNICKDVDECLNPNVCNKDTHECINQIGGHTCRLVRCANGYKLLNGYCEDNNECEDADICGKFGVCRNALGTYYCDCKLGYRYNSDTRKCEDIDECKLGRHRCSFKCVNTPGSYHCICPSGYEARGQHQAFCYDIDECATQKPCAATENCFNTYGSYRCINETCPKPYYIRSASNGGQKLQSCWKQCHQVRDKRQKSQCFKDGDSYVSVKRAAFKYEKEIIKSNGTTGFEFTYWWQFSSTVYDVAIELVKGNEENLFEMIRQPHKDELKIVNKDTIAGPREFHIVMETTVTQIGDSKPSWRYQYHIYIFISRYRLI